MVAAGGDGTINEVVNGIAPLEKRPKMAIIPGGTTNDYARALKIPRTDIKSSCGSDFEAADSENGCRKTPNTYFINIAAGGHLTELTYDVPSELKSVLAT